MSANLRDTLTAEIEAHGGEVLRVEITKHQRIVFMWQGREMFYVASVTTSDWRAAENALTDLRRQMGVKRLVHKSTRPKRRRDQCRVEPPPQIDPVEPRRGMEQIFDVVR